MTRDASVREHQLAPGTRRRVLSYAAAYKGSIAIFLGWLFLSEVPPMLAIVGGALSLLGVALARRRI